MKDPNEVLYAYVQWISATLDLYCGTVYWMIDRI